MVASEISISISTGSCSKACCSGRTRWERRRCLAIHAAWIRCLVAIVKSGIEIWALLIVVDLPRYKASFKQRCPHCHALRLPKETLDGCCCNGKIQLTKHWFKEPPQRIVDIYKDPLFQKHSILLNKVLSFVLDLSNLKNDSRNGVKCAVITGSVKISIDILQSIHWQAHDQSNWCKEYVDNMNYTVSLDET